MATKPIQHVCVIGAGAWGTALAEVISRAGRDVTLYARDKGLVDIINKAHENPAYLPGIRLDPRLRATISTAAAVKNAELVLFATPAQHFRATLEIFGPDLPAGLPIVNAAKGIEIKTGKLLSEVAEDVLPGHPYGVLSGPSFALETAQGLPAANTLASSAPEAEVMRWAEALRGQAFRPYFSADPAGAEVAGALKNVIAVACGIVEGRRLGQNARVAVMTRGMAEIRRFGLARGARAGTFLGLSGLGDLTLTCNSVSSRNFSLGVALGEGKKLEAVMAGRRGVAEGVYTARAATTYAQEHGIDMPIISGVDAVLHGNARVADVIQGLLSRDLRREED